ncbi:Pectinesterase PPME1 [Platanthera zijinensis]|uniref:Pectinesterase n=1 Tax=Platanthera zijinensis TaxID=2320716 RepID=A0AAP0BAX6_9ASPA
MAGAPPNSGSPAIFLIIVLLSVVHAATAHYSSGSTSSSVELEQWISDSLDDFHFRAGEIAGGVNVGLDTKLYYAEKRRRVITVRQDGNGDFSTISGAIASVPENNRRRVVIRIGPGIYREKVKIEQTKPFITFSGGNRRHAMPVITYDGTAAMNGTFNSGTVIVESNYFIASNIIFENTAPRPVMGEKGGQAVALRISGDKAAFYGCRFLGFQDTLCDDRGRHFFNGCFIQGTVDFIFGNGKSMYLPCGDAALHYKLGGGREHLHIGTGRSTIADKSGFSFVHCNITGTGSAYLSRAWRKSSRVVFAHTYMGTLVNPRGWDDKGFPDRHRTVFYGEYKCMGPGASTRKRVNYVKILTDEQARPFMSMTFIRAKTWLLPQPNL